MLTADWTARLEWNRLGSLDGESERDGVRAKGDGGGQARSMARDRGTAWNVDCGNGQEP